ncbi:MAG: DUF4912 domain-containing protein [Planctomycetes bacterium]|nr:DUF4912 domain-containing protein [Planctomycetota bacterium]
MSREKWELLSRSALHALAQRKGIAGASRMTKAELVVALVKWSKARTKAKQRKPERAKPQARPQLQAAHHSNGSASTEEQVERSKYTVGTPTKDLSAKVPKELPKGYGKDRIVCMVRDPYWLHTYWELTRQSVQRAEAALGHDWHGSKPILRVVDITARDVSPMSESAVKDIDIHGGCNNWYIDVSDPPRSYRIDIGYLARNGRFYVLARSNVVTTPRAGMSDVIDENWADLDREKADRIFAMSGGFDPGASSLELKQLFEERLRRPMGSPAVTSFGSGAFQYGKERGFRFELNAELIVYGSTEPDAKVTIQGEPIKLRSDGTFTMRFSLPDGRQIMPAVAYSADGVEERTIVLAVERNTRHLEPVVAEMEEMG